MGNSTLSTGGVNVILIGITEVRLTHRGFLEFATTKCVFLL